MRGCQPSASSLCSVAEVAMCVTSALEPRCFRHSLMSDSSCPISSFPSAKNIFIGICSPFPTGGRPDRPSEWLSAEVATSVSRRFKTRPRRSVSDRRPAHTNRSLAFPLKRRCFYYFFMAVVVVGYETTATARWALPFIVRAFFDDTITVAVWTGFHGLSLIHI